MEMDAVESSSPSVGEEIEDIKKRTAALEQRAKAEAEHLHAVFFEEKRKMLEAWDAFVVASDHHKKTKQIIMACNYEQQQQQQQHQDGEEPQRTLPREIAAATTTTSTAAVVVRSRKRNAAITTRRKRNARVNAPVRVRQDWTQANIERLRRSASRVNRSLKGNDFWIALHREYGIKRRRLGSVRSKARRLGIKPPSG